MVKSIAEASQLCSQLETQYRKLDQLKSQNDVKILVTKSGKEIQVSVGKGHFLNRLYVWYHTQFKKDYVFLEQSLLSTLQNIHTIFTSEDIWQSPNEENAQALLSLSNTMSRLKDRISNRSSSELTDFSSQLSQITQKVFETSEEMETINVLSSQWDTLEKSVENLPLDDSEVSREIVEKVFRDSNKILNDNRPTASHIKSLQEKILHSPLYEKSLHYAESQWDALKGQLAINSRNLQPEVKNLRLFLGNIVHITNQQIKEKGQFNSLLTEVAKEELILKKKELEEKKTEITTQMGNIVSRFKEQEREFFKEIAQLEIPESVPSKTSAPMQTLKILKSAVNGEEPGKNWQAELDKIGILLPSLYAQQTPDRWQNTLYSEALRQELNREDTSEQHVNEALEKTNQQIVQLEQEIADLNPTIVAQKRLASLQNKLKEEKNPEFLKNLRSRIEKQEIKLRQLPTLQEDYLHYEENIQSIQRAAELLGVSENPQAIEEKDLAAAFTNWIQKKQSNPEVVGAYAKASSAIKSTIRIRQSDEYRNYGGKIKEAQKKMAQLQEQKIEHEKSLAALQKWGKIKQQYNDCFHTLYDIQQLQITQTANKKDLEEVDRDMRIKKFL